MEEITQEELNERVEILKKLRALLEMQRNPVFLTNAEYQPATIIRW